MRWKLLGCRTESVSTVVVVVVVDVIGETTTNAVDSRTIALFGLSIDIPTSTVSTVVILAIPETTEEEGSLLVARLLFRRSFRLRSSGRRTRSRWL